MYVRARVALGEVSIHRGLHIKREGKAHVNLDEAMASWRRLVRWQCRIGATHIATVDATRQKVQVGKLQVVVGARAGVFHDGTLVGGVLQEVEGNDNYLGELAGQIDVFGHGSIDKDSRVIVVFDATSPIRSLHTFRHIGARARQGKHAAHWIEALDELAKVPQCVAWLWQPSHCGDPVNELADLAAH
jgi:hypothetical protein